MQPGTQGTTDNPYHQENPVISKTFSELLAVTESALSLKECFHKPDSLLNEDAVYLKKGGSATVARITIQGKDYVLKRYNLKNLGHRLRRAFRATRAWRSWMAGRRLLSLGVNTPEPLLVLEKRWGIFRGTSYLLTEYCPGSNLLQLCESAPEETLQQVVSQLDRLLHVFKREKIAHGDFKASNFIWNGQLYLIDLDAIQWFKSERQWRNAYNADLDRLLQNWPKNSPAHRAFSVLLHKYR